MHTIPTTAASFPVTAAIVAALEHGSYDAGARQFLAVPRPPAPRSGGLAPWQERRAKQLIEANLDGGLSVADLARECRLSVSQFSRCFRQSVGIAPHRWLVQRRIEAAKSMLSRPGRSLVDIGLACGFADQSHFTRVFTRFAGCTPGTWRRETLRADA